MLKRSITNIRDYLPQLADPAPEQRAQARILLADAYGDQTRRLLYQLLTDPDLQVRQQAARGLASVDEGAAGYLAAPSLRELHIGCLGPLRLDDGHRTVRFGDWAALQGGRAGWLKVLGVFAYLVHRGRGGATREEIGAAVWDRPVSATSLARTLTTLRQTLSQLISPAFVEEALVINSERASFNVDTYLTDAQIFERLVEVALDTEERAGLAAATPFYTLAVDQYAGPYMQDIPAADDIYHERRHQLMNDFVITIERLAEHAYTRHYYRDCLVLCRRGLEAEPASEDLMLWLLQSWNQLKRYGEIEHAYRAYLRTTGIDPRSAEGQADTVVQFYTNKVKHPHLVP